MKRILLAATLLLLAAIPAEAKTLEIVASFSVLGEIVKEVAGISRVVYDISGKPPATIEWE